MSALWEAIIQLSKEVVPLYVPPSNESSGCSPLPQCLVWFLFLVLSFWETCSERHLILSVCVTPMRNDVGTPCHVLTRHACINSFVKCLCQFFARFSNGYIFVTDFVVILYLAGMQFLLSDTYIMKIFSQTVPCLVIFLLVSFDEQIFEELSSQY